jgi:hypothetical protein
VAVGEEEELPGEAAAIERAFGVANRRRILADYASRAGVVTPQNAWQHVYRLLLWINPTISLAHCYESDKCQPHKAWYARSLAFHQWVSDQLGVSPLDLREQIDQLFRQALPALAQIETEARRQAATRHLGRYETGSMPLPGDDPDLVDIITRTLGLDRPSDPDLARQLVERVYTHFARENKRKNLLGRGFEDTLAALIDQIPGHEGWEVRTRMPLGQIPGFLPQSEQLKRSEVDLVFWERNGRGRRIIVTVKWSVRADRERQFDSDFEDYSRSNAGDPFDYVLVTNEFDAARLDAACARVYGRGHLFSSVVHVQPEAVLVAYGKEADPAKPGSRRKAGQLRNHLASGRLAPLESWLSEVLE